MRSVTTAKDDFSTLFAVEGTGLGLVLSRQLLLAMQGEIHVSSAPERGTTFRVMLPAAH